MLIFAKNLINTLIYYIMETKEVKKVETTKVVKNEKTQATEPKAKGVTSTIAKVTKVIKSSKAKAEKPQKVKSKETPNTTKAKVTKEVEAQQKANLIEGVVANREVKYIYPDDVTDTLARKKWRQQVRNKLKDLERAWLRIQNENTKESRAAKKALEDYKSQVLKQGVEIA